MPLDVAADHVGMNLMKPTLNSLSRSAMNVICHEGVKASGKEIGNRRGAAVSGPRVRVSSRRQNDALPIERTMPIDGHWLALTTSGGDFAFGSEKRS